MQYRKLGSTGLDISPICLGCMGFGEPTRGYPGWSIDETESRAVIRHALDAGINFFDTANLYSRGGSEEILGKALRDFGERDRLVVATKLSAPMRNGPNAMGLSRKTIMAEVDHSLQRLGMDYIDLLQIHRRDQRTPWEETLEALHDLVKAGKVRYLGASSMKAWEFSKALHLQKARGWARFVSMQDTYNLLAREEEREMLPLCQDEGVQTVVYSPLARGRLARAWGETTVRSQAEPHAANVDASDREIIGNVCQIAQTRGIAPAQVALAWLLGKPVVGAAIVGAMKTRYIDDAVAALGLGLSAEEVETLEAPYTPRRDGQGISDPAVLGPQVEAATGFRTSAA